MNYKNLLKPNHITIFTKTGCKYCNLVKETFKVLQIKALNEINVSNMEDTTYNSLIDDLTKNTNHYTYPFVFIDTVFCGGNSDIQQLKITGTLYKLLRKYNIDFKVDCTNIVKYTWPVSSTKHKDFAYSTWHQAWASIIGLKEGKDSVYKFIEYNKFEDKPTKIPDKAKKESLDKKFIENYIYGNKVPVQEDKSLFDKYKNDKNYLTYNDIFSVFVNKNYVDIFKLPNNVVVNNSTKLNKYHYTKKIASYKPIRVLTTYGSILIDLGNNKYAFIDDKVYEFTTKDKLVALKSDPDDGWSYAYALDEHDNVYLLMYGIIMKNFSLIKDEPYIWYNDNKNSKEEYRKFKIKSVSVSDSKEKIRKGPTNSATLFNVGTIKTGNDGNKWTIIETKSGIKRWKKL